MSKTHVGAIVNPPSADGFVSHVVVIAAMRAEAAPMIERLGLVRQESAPWPAWCPMELWSGSDVSLVVHGVDLEHSVDLIGTQAATLAAASAVDALRPDLIISAGTCGSWASRGGAIGRVYVTGGPFVYHDRRVALPGFDEASRGGYAFGGAAELAAELGYPTGVVTTGDGLDATPECAARMLASGAVVKDMEAAASAWIASRAGVGFLAVKSATDLVDGEHATPEQFLANFDRAVAHLADVVEAVLSRVRGTPRSLWKAVPR